MGLRDVVELALDMPVELIAANPRVTENSGKRAVRRGPLVYCMEETNNKNIGFDDAILDQNTVSCRKKAKEN